VVFAATSDGAHTVALQQVDAQRVRVGWDGAWSKAFRLLPQRSGDLFEWSPGRLHVGWYGERESQLFVAIDGVEHPCEGVTRSVPPTFSDAGGHVAFGVFVAGVPRLMLDGQLVGDSRLAPIRPAFSEDGSRFAYVAENREVKPGEKPRDYRQWVVVDGVAQPEADGISSPEGFGLQFSPDGRRFAYGRIDGEGVRLVVDGAIGERHDDMFLPTFSPDSRRFVYGVKARDRFTMTGDGVPAGMPYWRLGPPVFSPDSARLAFVGFRSKDHGVAVVDGIEGEEVTDFWDNVQFSADSRHAAYLGIRKAGGFLSRAIAVSLVRDGVAGQVWDEVGSAPHFSPDGEHVAFSARRGKQWSVVLDDAPGQMFDEVSPPRFSATGRLGYFAHQGAPGGDRYTMIVDGTPGPAMDEGTPAAATELFAFSPDGEHIATAGRFDGLWRPVIDDAVGPGGLGVGNLLFENGRASFLVSGPDGAHRVSTQLATR